MATTAAKGNLEWDFSWRNLLRGKFPNEKEEELFQLYIRNQKLKIIPAVVFAMLVYLMSQTVLNIVMWNLTDRLSHVVVYCVFTAFALGVLGLLRIHKDTSDWITTLAFASLWVAACFITFFDVAYRDAHNFISPVVGWIQLDIFTTYVVLPLRLRYVMGACLMMVLGACLEEALLWSFGNSGAIHDINANIVLSKQVGADLLLFLGAMGLGFLVFVFSDSMQRRSFLESKKTHTIGYQLRKIYREQERLLLSVLPKHIADEMMQDLGVETISGQFRKIYMNRCEDVSILFADIVGFTAISSSVTAAELVKILNELFASFDDLAKKYHQQRIKILGDCYYCVCGALAPRRDHAVLAIHMGMAMVDEIRAVRESTGKNVNMRVGIHTGSVLGGVLGQRQWQYDVLGKEVLLANHMESGGIPARVHISETTKALLNGEFELEPGNGPNRDDYLKQINMKTYLIKSVIKPYPQGTLDELPENEKDPSVKETEAEGDSELEEKAEVSDHDDQLRAALLDRTRSVEAMKEMSMCTTWFHDSEREARYRARQERFGGVSMYALCGVLLLATAAKLTVLSGTVIMLVSFIASELVLLVMATISSAVSIMKQGPGKQAFLRFSSFIEGNRIVRSAWGVAAIFVLVIADISVVIQCDPDMGNTTTNAFQDLAVDGNSNTFSDSRSSHGDHLCSNPAYFVHVSHLILISVSSLVHIEHVTKLMLIVGSTTTYAVIYMVVFGNLFDQYDQTFLQSEKQVPTKYMMSVQLICASLSLIVLNRKMEEISRHLFLWKEESEKQTNQVTTLRHKNEALIYNILPAEVASHFVGRQKESKDLYSKSYEHAAVMFAACPNFHDFYSESAINNEGLECLRFLNEIISDYDDLLRRPRFHSITKIKTVGATYMAASGMVQISELEAMMMAKNVKMRWNHLDELVQFAMSMKEELTKINEQSFNNFILRIGIHHGPIIAGVIGAGKPHYDIWGNTVNVASRMESTGQLGKIQVVEETKQILEEFGYYFQVRGIVSVKGKGDLKTYFLEGKDTSKKPPPKKASLSSAASTSPPSPTAAKESHIVTKAEAAPSKEALGKGPAAKEHPHRSEVTSGSGESSSESSDSSSEMSDRMGIVSVEKSWWTVAYKSMFDQHENLNGKPDGQPGEETSGDPL